MPEFLTPLIITAVMIALFYFLFYRPQMKRQRAQQRMQSDVAAGDRVMLISGIHAKVVAREGEDLLLEIADGVEVRAAQVAILRRLDDPAPDTSADSEEPTIDHKDEKA